MSRESDCKTFPDGRLFIKSNHDKILINFHLPVTQNLQLFGYLLKTLFFVSLGSVNDSRWVTVRDGFDGWLIQTRQFQNLSFAKVAKKDWKYWPLEEAFDDKHGLFGKSRTHRGSTDSHRWRPGQESTHRKIFLIFLLVLRYGLRTVRLPRMWSADPYFDL